MILEKPWVYLQKNIMSININFRARKELDDFTLTSLLTRAKKANEDGTFS